MTEARHTAGAPGLDQDQPAVAVTAESADAPRLAAAQRAALHHQPAVVVTTESEDATRRFAAELASFLQPGDVVALTGELGAGKTRLVQGVARALGVPEELVSSPTFTLVHEYPGRIPLRHCDAYRLRRPEEFADLGLDELFAEDGIALVEWADRVAGYLPADCLWVQLTTTAPEQRRIRVSGRGPRGQALAQQFAGAK